MTIQIEDNNDLLSYIIQQSAVGGKNWFGFPQQKIIGIHLAYEIAKLHADKMSSDDIVNFVINLNNKIYTKIIKGE
jgi:hypothetical protein|tara:strand:- start:1537 stop:1764 length:228 start_codon:yes stop_codon:yes gene_type:complete